MCFVCTCIWKVAWYTVHVCCEVSFGVHVIITCSNYYCWLVIIYYYYTVCAVMEFRILWLLSPLLSVSLILWDCYISTCRSCLKLHYHSPASSKLNAQEKFSNNLPCFEWLNRWSTVCQHVPVFCVVKTFFEVLFLYCSLADQLSNLFRAKIKWYCFILVGSSWRKICGWSWQVNWYVRGESVTILCQY